MGRDMRTIVEKYGSNGTCIGKVLQYTKKDAEQAYQQFYKIKKENKMKREKTQYTFVIGKDGVTVYINGESYTVGASHVNFDKIINVIKKGKSPKKLLKLIDTKTAIIEFCRGLIKIKAGVLFYDNEPIRNSLTVKIIRMMEEGFDIGPMINFLERLPV